MRDATRRFLIRAHETDLDTQDLGVFAFIEDGVSINQMLTLMGRSEMESFNLGDWSGTEVDGATIALAAFQQCLSPAVKLGLVSDTAAEGMACILYGLFKALHEVALERGEMEG